MNVKDEYNFHGKENKRLGKIEPTNKEGTARGRISKAFTRLIWSASPVKRLSSMQKNGLITEVNYKGENQMAKLSMTMDGNTAGCLCSLCFYRGCYHISHYSVLRYGRVN